MDADFGAGRAMSSGGVDDFGLIMHCGCLCSFGNQTLKSEAQ